MAQERPSHQSGASLSLCTTTAFLMALQTHTTQHTQLHHISKPYLMLDRHPVHSNGQLSLTLHTHTCTSLGMATSCSSINVHQCTVCDASGGKLTQHVKTKRAINDRTGQVSPGSGKAAGHKHHPYSVPGVRGRVQQSDRKGNHKLVSSCLSVQDSTISVGHSEMQTEEGYC